MAKYKLYAVEKNQKNICLNICSSKDLNSIDCLTSRFESQEQLLENYGLDSNNYWLLLVFNDSQSIPITYSKYLEDMRNIDLLNYKLLSKSDNYYFLQELIKLYKNNILVKNNVKRIKNSVKKIDKYSFQLIPLSNCFYISSINEILKSKTDFIKKDTILSNIEFEKDNIKENLYEILDKFVYSNDYFDLRNLCIILHKYDQKTDCNAKQKSLNKQK